jgi:hypothetical protein
LKIISFFPEAKRNLKLQNIYNGSRDGWETAIFTQKVFNQGPTLIVLKTTQGSICGGYTSKNWCGSSGCYTDDIDAFVFNMTHKYIPNNSQMAINTRDNGFRFGECILELTGTILNQHEKGWCCTGKKYGYDIEGDVSPLTNQRNKFTCAQLEVYKVIYS